MCYDNELCDCLRTSVGEHLHACALYTLVTTVFSVHMCVRVYLCVCAIQGSTQSLFFFFFFLWSRAVKRFSTLCAQKKKTLFHGEGRPPSQRSWLLMCFLWLVVFSLFFLILQWRSPKSTVFGAFLPVCLIFIFCICFYSFRHFHSHSSFSLLLLFSFTNSVVKVHCLRGSWFFSVLIVLVCLCAWVRACVLLRVVVLGVLVLLYGWCCFFRMYLCMTRRLLTSFFSFPFTFVRKHSRVSSFWLSSLFSFGVLVPFSPLFS